MKQSKKFNEARKFSCDQNMRLITQTSEEQELDQIKQQSTQFLKNHFEKRKERAEQNSKARMQTQ